MALIERMKMTYLGVYVCLGKSEESFKLREIPSGREVPQPKGTRNLTTEI